jgi:hypothetical protein
MYSITSTDSKRRNIFQMDPHDAKCLGPFQALQLTWVIWTVRRERVITSWRVHWTLLFHLLERTLLLANDDDHAGRHHGDRHDQ